MSKNALTVENLNKIYSDNKTKKGNHALTNLTFEVKEGEIFGLLGPNGAGKTTFLSILGGTVTKTSGLVNVWGFDLDKNSEQNTELPHMLPTKEKWEYYVFYKPPKASRASLSPHSPIIVRQAPHAKCVLRARVLCCTKDNKAYSVQ